jgi:(2Fe-2S) ferredoxin
MPVPERQVLVCVNARPAGHPKGSCGEKGSKELYDKLKSMMRERGLHAHAMAQSTSCLKHCSQGIVVAVQPDNQWYANVKPEDLEELCARHLEKGERIDRLQMPDIPWE